jgi:hypothetical protein
MRAALARVVTETVRVVDHDVKPGVESDMGDGDAWPAILSKSTSGYTIPGQAWTYWNRGRARETATAATRAARIAAIPTRRRFCTI